MKLIVGLGNPGADYVNTRHNVGFIVIDNFAKSYGISINKKKFNGQYAELFIDGEKVLLLKPLSYMNLSGEVVKKYLDYFDIMPEDVLVISDDLYLPFASYRLRLFGSSGGHNGLKNIANMIGTNRFKRFRIGISNDKSVDTKDYVLGKFNSSEMKQISDILPITVDILNDFCSMSFEKVMSKYNQGMIV